MRKTFICSRCGQEYPVSEYGIFDDHELCRNCYDTETCLCDHCGSRIWAEDSCGDENHSLCHECERRYYQRCTDCGQLVDLEALYFLAGDDSEGYCKECYEYRLYRGTCK